VTIIPYGKTSANPGLAAARHLWWSSLFAPANPSTVFRHISELRQGDKAVTVARVSDYTQAENLPIGVANLRRAVEDHGGTVVYEYAYVGHGGEAGWYPAVIAAQERGATVLAFETVDRCLRPSGFYRSKRDADGNTIVHWDASGVPYGVSDYDHNAPYLEWDLGPLRRLCQRHGLTLMTVAHPDATPGECRSFQTKRGQAAKGKGGRPRKVDTNRAPGYLARRRAKAMERIRELAAMTGWRWGLAATIAREFEVPRKTACQWVQWVQEAGVTP
jgi:hypothetical protein